MSEIASKTKRVWIVLGWQRSGRHVSYCSTWEQRWHWTFKSAKVEREEARKQFPKTKWTIVRMVPR